MEQRAHTYAYADDVMTETENEQHTGSLEPAFEPRRALSMPQSLKVAAEASASLEAEEVAALRWSIDTSHREEMRMLIALSEYPATFMGAMQIQRQEKGHLRGADSQRLRRIADAVDARLRELAPHFRALCVKQNERAA